MDEMQRLTAIKERLANQQASNEPASQTPEPGGAGAPAEPVQEPAPQVPEAAPDPRLVELQQELEAERDKLKTLEEQGAQREQELQNILAAAKEKAKLPSAKELDDMSQGEAISKSLEAMMAQVEQRIQGVVSDLNRNVVAPTLKKVGSVELQQKRAIAVDAYPGVDMNKYRKAFDTMAEKYPEMSAVQVLKAVADPRDLSSSNRTPTTPNAVQPAGAHMETGVSAHGSAARTATRPNSAPTVRDYLETSQALREQGDRYGADQVRRAAVAKRLADQGVIPRG